MSGTSELAYYLPGFRQASEVTQRPTTQPTKPKERHYDWRRKRVEHKFRPPQDPFDYEKTQRDIKAPYIWTESVASQGLRDGDLRTANAMALGQIKAKHTKDRADREFSEQFRRWLTKTDSVAKYPVSGTGYDDGAKELRTQGKRFELQDGTFVRVGANIADRSLTMVPEVGDYITSFIRAQGEFKKKFIPLVTYGPANLNEAYLYYKYVVVPGFDAKNPHRMQEFLNDYDYYVSQAQAAQAGAPAAHTIVPDREDDLERGHFPARREFGTTATAAAPRRSLIREVPASVNTEDIEELLLEAPPTSSETTDVGIGSSGVFVPETPVPSSESSQDTLSLLEAEEATERALQLAQLQPRGVRTRQQVIADARRVALEEGPDTRAEEQAAREAEARRLYEEQQARAEEERIRAEEEQRYIQAQRAAQRALEEAKQREREAERLALEEQRLQASQFSLTAPRTGLSLEEERALAQQKQAAAPKQVTFDFSNQAGTIERGGMQAIIGDEDEDMPEIEAPSSSEEGTSELSVVSELVEEEEEAEPVQDISEEERKTSEALASAREAQLQRAKRRNELREQRNITGVEREKERKVPKSVDDVLMIGYENIQELPDSLDDDLNTLIEFAGDDVILGDMPMFDADKSYFNVGDESEKAQRIQQAVEAAKEDILQAKAEDAADNENPADALTVSDVADTITQSLSEIASDKNETGMSNINGANAKEIYKALPKKYYPRGREMQEMRSGDFGAYLNSSIKSRKGNVNMLMEQAAREVVERMNDEQVIKHTAYILRLYDRIGKDAAQRRARRIMLKTLWERMELIEE